MRRLGIICLFVFVILNSYDSLKHPAYNWDLLGYVASALSLEETDQTRIHERTYRVVETSIPPDAFRAIVSKDDPYRSKMQTDPQAFSRQIYVYRLKPLYGFLMYLLNKTGIPLVVASVFISAVSAAVIFYISFIWLSRHISSAWTGLISLVIGLLAGLPHLSRLSTPDALSGALMLTALYFLLEKRRPAAGILLLLLSIPARIDNIMFIILITPFFVFGAPVGYSLSKKTGTILFFLAVCVYWLIRQGSGTDGWWYQFNHAFLGDREGSLPDQIIPFSLGVYLPVLTLGLFRIFFDGDFLTMTPVIALHGIAVYFWPLQRNPPAQFYKHVILVMISYIAVHFILFPVIDDRFFVIQNVMILLSSIMIYSMKKQTLNQS